MRAVDLACRRAGRLLFEHLDFEVPVGHVVWVRGQNGRGKTSLLRLAAGLSRPEHGQLMCDGLRRFIGHANALKEDLTVGESLQFLLRLHGHAAGRPAVHAALARLGLRGRHDTMVRTLSQGQRRRVALARLAAEDLASLWILDEPFDALDADGSERLNALLAEHVGRGGSVLLSSHSSLPATGLPLTELDLDCHVQHA